jgi:transcription antitermination factor NusA-like protein
MPFIEVFDPSEHSFYRGELHGVTGKFASVVFENASEPTKVETHFIRPEPEPVPDGFTPQLHASVEVRFHMPEQAPSYWEGTVHKIIGGQALVKFPNPNFNNVFEFNLLRPATGLMVGECVFEFVPVPSDCHEDFMEHNKPAIDYVYKTSHLISLCFVPAKRALALYGFPPAVSEAKSLLSIALVRSKQLNIAMKRSAAKGGRSLHQAVETFTIPTCLVKHALGKGGKNIIEVKRSLELQDVTFDKVAEDESQTLVSVFADSKEKGVLAKKQLHYVEQIVPIQDRNSIGAIIGPSGSTIRDMMKETAVSSIVIKDQENPAQIVVQGLKDGVDHCVKMIAIICLYEPEMRSLEGELQGAGAARAGGHRFQSFQERQQRTPAQQGRPFSSEDFPSLPAGQSVGKQKPAASVAPLAAAPAPAATPSQDAAPPPRSSRGGRGGRAGKIVAVREGGKADGEHELEDAPPVVHRGGKAQRGDGARREHQDEQIERPGPLRGNKEKDRGLRIQRARSRKDEQPS